MSLQTTLLQHMAYSVVFQLVSIITLTHTHTHTHTHTRTHTHTHTHTDHQPVLRWWYHLPFLLQVHERVAAILTNCEHIALAGERDVFKDLVHFFGSALEHKVVQILLPEIMCVYGDNYL